MASAPDPVWLIINADDYGYFRGVSRSIVECARRGIVTATGVFGNAPELHEQAAWLRECESLDTGVHLNLTEGEPLSADMRPKLARWGGRFPPKFRLAAAILTGAVTRTDVRVEWSAQIERCLTLGLRPCFLNSHEHIHMLPSLFPLTCELAAAFGIPHVRFTTAAGAGSDAGVLLRGAVVRLLAMVDRRLGGPPAPRFLGLVRSGRLDRTSLDQELEALRPGAVHELMCHPGRLESGDQPDERLRTYHAWEAEHATFSDPTARERLAARGVRVIGYRHLEIRDGQLAVRAAATPRP